MEGEAPAVRWRRLPAGGDYLPAAPPALAPTCAHAPLLWPPCRWVHVDPLTLAVDQARKAESNLPHESQPLAYVAALAGGGAKDVTQRCGRGGRGLGCGEGQARAPALLRAPALCTACAPAALLACPHADTRAAGWQQRS